MKLYIVINNNMVDTLVMLLLMVHYRMYHHIIPKQGYPPPQNYQDENIPKLLRTLPPLSFEDVLQRRQNSDEKWKVTSNIQWIKKIIKSMGIKSYYRRDTKNTIRSSNSECGSNKQRSRRQRQSLKNVSK
ncbi:uncharacterized protein [Euwallacea similis]|uniref:uncharacterized protein n=1 Tax=Euwallacea similis TaxID=1736056 RepID=UPI00344B7A57